MNYLMLCEDMYYNQETGEVVSFSALPRPVRVSIPFWLWSFRESLGRGVDNGGHITGEDFELFSVTCMRLNNCQITATKRFGSIMVEFFDKKQNKNVHLKVAIERDNLGILRDKLHRTAAMRHFVWVDGEYRSSRNYRLKFDTGSKAAKCMTGLSECFTREARTEAMDVFSYGFCKQKFSVVYNGRCLEKEYHAFLCGTWAVLLNDDLSFNSVVVVNDVRPYSLVVENILYTVDPYLVRMHVLARDSGILKYA